MKHFFLSQSSFLSSDDCKRIIFTEKDFHYLKNVLRLSPGDTFPGIDDQGNKYNLTLLTENSGTFIAEYILTNIIDKPVKQIYLYQSLLKGSKWDTLVRQITEAGITHIVPLQTEFTVLKIKDKRDIDNKTERWNRIIKEAVQQSGRAFMPRIEKPVIFKDLIPPEGINLFFHQKMVDQNSLHGYLSSDPSRINLYIGPEGGFSDKEIIWMLEKGFKPAYLGDSVLRAETAAIYALAAVRTILLEIKHWRLP